MHTKNPNSATAYKIYTCDVGETSTHNLPTSGKIIISKDKINLFLL